VGRMGTLFSLLILEGIVSFPPPIQYDVGYRFVIYIAFIILRNVPSISSFFRAFIMKGCWLLSKAFSASVDMVM
jgi:hypothetical protein